MDVLANFRHVTSKLKDVKHAGFKTSKLKKEIKKQEWENHNTNEHSVYSVLVCFLFNFMAPYGICDL